MSTTIQHTCRPATGGQRVLNLEHERDCNLSGCPGCAPCNPRWGHCAKCKAEHLDSSHARTCASCVGKVRNDILEIGDQITEAHQQQVYRAVGSVAFMLSAPAGNYEAGMYIHQSAMSGRLCRCRQRGLPTCLGDLPVVYGPACDGPCPHPSCYAVRRPPVCPDTAFILEELRLDEMHPFTVFGAWEMHWRQLQNQDPADGTDANLQSAGADHTTWSSARYLLDNLTHMAQLPEDESDFAQLADEVSSSRRWLEDVLRLGHRPDRAGLCLMCKKEKLVKDWNTEDEGTQYDQSRDDKDYGDTWYCPNPDCNQVYKPGEYGPRLDVMWIESADRLPAREMARRTRVAESTIRRWAAQTKKLISPVRVVDGELVDAVWKITPARLRPAGKSPDGRKVYLVTDVETLRDTLRKAAS